MRRNARISISRAFFFGHSTVLSQFSSFSVGVRIILIIVHSYFFIIV
jgi:hypothetical protein